MPTPRPRSIQPSALAALLLLAPSIAPPMLTPAPARAGSRTLQVAPLISRTPGGPCPNTLTLIETLQPYREGSYGVEGRAPLLAIATGWRLDSRDAVSASWIARLRAPYQHCTATAGVVRLDGESTREHSYLRLRFDGGQLRLILDMTGLRDPNGYTPAILSADLREGEPVWSWGGSD